MFLLLLFLFHMQEASGLTYQCVFGSEVRSATRISKTSVECIIGNGQQVGEVM